MNKKLKLWELNRVTDQEFKSQDKFPITVVLDSIRSLTNVGTFFRTCDAFNVDKIYLCGITAEPPHREIQKTALGATESMDWQHRESIVELVQEVKHLPDEHYVLVFGNEVNGVDQDVIDLSDHIIEIPQFGTKHSLNVSVCAGIVMWEFAKKWID